MLGKCQQGGEAGAIAIADRIPDVGRDRLPTSQSLRRGKLCDACEPNARARQSVATAACRSVNVASSLVVADQLG
jgi:hypothetical protein